MDTAVNQYMGRAGHELRLSVVLRNLSQSDLRAELGARREDTFYSAAISHAYYAIFYSAKALLLSAGIKTYPRMSTRRHLSSSGSASSTQGDWMPSFSGFIRG